MPAHRASTFLLALFLAFVPAPSAFADTEEDFDQKILSELRGRDPAAAEIFVKGNAAREAGDHAAAAEFFHQVTTMVPDYSHAWRREGYELLAMDRRADALERMQKALDLERSPWNLAGLARVLATGVGKEGPSAVDLNQAESLVREAIAQREDPDLSFLACQLAVQKQDNEWLAAETAHFLRLAPQSPWAHFFDSIRLATRGDIAGAERSLEQARSLGLPEAAYRDFKGQLQRSSGPWSRLPLGLGALVLGIWLAGMLLLVLVGSFLSRATLDASRRIPQAKSGSALGLDATLRKTYATVLNICCAYYFVSIPIVIAIVLLTGGGLVYAMLMLGRIPVKLLVLVVVLTVVTLWAIVKSVFIRARDQDPGLKLNTDQHPRLRRVLDDVARKIDTRPVTNVYLTPGTEMAVMERGGMLKQLRGHSERCLILGVGTLEGMKMRPFRAVLAHEYGHFSNRDTAGGGFALAVRLSLMNTAVSLARSGAAAWYNPAWLFVNGFYRVFLRVSQGASRLQEVLADRWAAFTYGSRAFADGLRHVIERSIRFDVHANSVLKEVIEGKKALANLYAYRPQAALMTEADVAGAVEEAIHKEPSPYDSHPRAADRIAWVQALGSDGGPAEPDDGEEVWSLFSDRKELERQLTDVVRGNVVVAHGVAIPTEGRAEEDVKATEG